MKVVLREAAELAAAKAVPGGGEHGGARAGLRRRRAAATAGDGEEQKVTDAAVFRGFAEAARAAAAKNPSSSKPAEGAEEPWRPPCSNTISILQLEHGSE